MNTHLKRIKTALVPVGTGTCGEAALVLARAIAREIILVGVVAVMPGESLSSGAKAARQVRQRLFALSSETVRYKSKVIVSESPWKELSGVIESEAPDLLVVEWQGSDMTCGLPMGEVLSNALCSVAVVRGARKMQFDRTLVAVRSGPHAELAVRVGMRLPPKSFDALHLSLSGASQDAAFKGLQHVLERLPEANLRSITTDDISRTIFEESGKYDAVVVGASAGNAAGTTVIGTVADRLLRESPATVIVVKTRQPVSDAMFSGHVGTQAISILVDKWFAENTYNADEFSDLRQLMALKEKQGTTISLALPALNEEKTVGKVITTIKRALMEEVPLVDEIVLIDSNSTDRTREIAADLGVHVHIHQELLPELEPRRGKGEALWKSLLVTRGEVICWIDTDIVNIHPRFVYGIIGPLLLNPEVQLVKGFYRRPLKVGDKIQAGGGGRVTELTARPLINLFYPELSGVIQPLSGEYAGRRAALETATFFSGYGVETGLLIDILERYGLQAIAQVDLRERIHHNQSLEALGKMSFAIIQTVLRKLEGRYERSIVEDVNKTMKIVRYAGGAYFLDVEEIAELDRPPMASLAAYRERHNR